MVCYKKTLLTFGSSGFAIFFLSLWSIWMYIDYEHIPNLIEIEKSGLTFSYIIVGAGTAGSVLANRLSLCGNVSVLLIEAGARFGPLTKIPLLATFSQQTKNDWGFMSTSQKYSSKGLINNQQYLARGKGLGGSSQLNYLLHFDDVEKDFDRWEQMGVQGWNYQAIKPFIHTLDNYCPETKYCFEEKHQDNHETTGEIESIYKIPRNYSKITEALSQVTEYKSIQKIRLSEYNTRNGIRWSVYEKFLRPIFKRKNLRILSGSTAQLIKFENRRAYSILVKSESGRLHEIFAKNEIILSAGAFQTPQLLQVSGIGSKNTLENFGITTVFDSPNVGQNLHDHFNLPLFVSITEPSSITVGKILNFREILRYLTTGEGHFANFGVLASILPESNDDKYGLSIFGTGAIDERALLSISNYKKEFFRNLFPFHNNSSQEGFVILATCLQPKSRGSVTISSDSVRFSPEINPNYLKIRSDVTCMIQGIRQAVEIIESKPFRQIGAKIHWPKLPTCKNLGPFARDFKSNQPSDQYLECIIRQVGLTSHHAGGTCAMNVGDEGVVDHQLRVKGVSGLRIVDASVLPTPISGVPNSAIIAIAKRAANFIKDDYS